jgi:hypothetical protein
MSWDAVVVAQISVYARRDQILAMPPERYARAAKRAAVLAKELADKAGQPISPTIQWLVDHTEAEIADRRRQR